MPNSKSRRLTEHNARTEMREFERGSASSAAEAEDDVPARGHAQATEGSQSGSASDSEQSSHPG